MYWKEIWHVIALNRHKFRNNEKISLAGLFETFFQLLFFLEVRISPIIVFLLTANDFVRNRSSITLFCSLNVGKKTGENFLYTHLNIVKIET